MNLVGTIEGILANSFWLTYRVMCYNHVHGQLVVPQSGYKSFKSSVNTCSSIKSTKLQLL